MANTIGSNIVNSITGGRLDAGNMAKVIAEAEVAGQRAIVDRNLSRVEKEQSGLEYLNLNLTGFNSFLTDLSRPDFFRDINASAANPEQLGVSVSENAAPGNYSVAVNQLAQSQTIVLNQVFSSQDSALAEGTVVFNQGGQSKTFEIGPANNTLESFQRSLNAADLGVTAAVINDGGEFRLMLSSSLSGEQQAFSVSGMPGFNFDINDPASGDAQLTSTAQNAQIAVNGVTINSNTNQFDNVIGGLNFTAKQVAGPQLVSVERNTADVVEAVQDFVLVYNQLRDILRDVGSTETLTEAQREDPAKEFTGVLAGSSILRNVQSQLRELVTSTVPGLQAPLNNLGSIGVSVNAEGEMSLDETMLNQALTANPAAVAAIFSRGGQSDEGLVEVLGGSDRTETGDYQVFVTSHATRASLQTDTTTLNASNEIEIGPDASFDIALNGLDPVSISLAEGNYTQQDFAQALQLAINSQPTIAASSARVDVQLDNNQFVLTSSQFGRNSEVRLENVTNLANAGLVDDAASGSDVQGQIVTASGDAVDLGTYANESDGRRIKVSEFAVSLSGNPVGVRGLELRVLGGNTDGATPTANITFSQGFAAQMSERVSNIQDKDTGLIGQRLAGLETRAENLAEQQSKLDIRFELAEQRYRLQFSALQTLLSQFDQTREFLTNTFNRPRN